MNAKNLKDLIFLDSRPYSYSECMSNFLPVPPFNPERVNDACLYYLGKYLIHLADSEDVRKELAKDFAEYHKAAKS